VEAFNKVNPHMEVKVLDAVHFTGETNTEEIAKLMLELFKRNVF